MRNLYLIFFILILFFCTGFSESVIDASILYQPNVEKLELIFKYFMPIKNGVIYTKVPRGLIVSIDEGVFFNSHEARIKESSLYILDMSFFQKCVLQMFSPSLWFVCDTVFQCIFTL